MTAPAYRWTCHNCGSANEARIDACEYCGFSAVASSVDIARARAEAKPLSPSAQVGNALGWWLFFPEGPIAGLIIIIAPVWAVILLMRGDIARAGVLLLGAAAGAYGIVWCIRRHYTWRAYFVVLAVIGLALLIHYL